MSGPNIKRLWAMKMAKDTIPSGGGFADGLKFFSSKESIINGSKAATEFVKNAIQAIRNAANPNPWRESSDEEIAGEILRRIDIRDKGKR